MKAARLAYKKALSIARPNNLFIINLKLATVDLFLASTQADVGVDYLKVSHFILFVLIFPKMLEEGLSYIKEALSYNNESAIAYLIAGKILLACNDMDNAQFALQKV